MTTWADWRDRIAQAIGGDHQTIESVDADLLAGRARAWMTPDACLVVEFVDYPGGARAVQVMWAAGELAAVIGELRQLEDWARTAGFTEMLIEGRAGWARLLRGRGYKPWSVTIRKEL